MTGGSGSGVGGEWQWGGITQRGGGGRRISFAPVVVKAREVGWHWLSHDDRVFSPSRLPLQNAFHGPEFFAPDFFATGGKPYLSFVM